MGISVRTRSFGVRRLTISLVVLLLMAALPAMGQRLDRGAPLPPELRGLSDRLALFQSVLARDFGLDAIYVGGGSSRAVLDAIYFGKELKTRDVDLFAVPGRKVTARFAGTIGARLKATYPQPLELADLEKRPRGNGQLAGRAAARYNAGFGVFLKEPGGDVFDLSLYHTRADLGLNGALNVDTIMIPLRAGETLWQHVEKMRGMSYGKAVRQGLVVDDHAGYKGWQQNRLSVAHPDELRSKPVLWAIRAARAFGKAGYENLPRAVTSAVKDGEHRYRVRPSLKLVKRYMQRLLDDPHADRELKMVKQTGVLQQHGGVVRLLGSPSRWTPERLRERLGEKR
jgi:hypothetical protein